MPEQSNKALVERMFGEVINNGNLDLIDELFDPAFVSHTGQGDLDLAAFKEFVRSWREGFADLHCEVSQVLEQGDKVSWTIRATGTQTGAFNGIPASGNRMDFMSMNHGIFRNGRALEHWVVMDMLTLLTQLGAVPAMA